MLPSFLSTLIWGEASSTSQDLEESPHNKDQKVEHTTQEREEGWLLVSQSRESADSTSGNSNTQDWDIDSLCSEGSWVVTPSLTLAADNGSTTAHPMEDLLIEHPTMSVYGGPAPSSCSDHGDEADNTELERQRQERQTLVMVRNRQRQEVANQLQVPLVEEGWVRGPVAGNGKQVRLTRRALKRQNNNSHKGGKIVNKAQKNTRKPGKRRC